MTSTITNKKFKRLARNLEGAVYLLEIDTCGYRVEHVRGDLVNVLAAYASLLAEEAVARYPKDALIERQPTFRLTVQTPLGVRHEVSHDQLQGIVEGTP